MERAAVDLALDGLIQLEAHVLPEFAMRVYQHRPDEGGVPEMHSSTDELGLREFLAVKATSARSC